MKKLFGMLIALFLVVPHAWAVEGDWNTALGEDVTSADFVFGDDDTQSIRGKYTPAELWNYLQTIGWGADPADTGAIRLSNNTGIVIESAPAGADITVLKLDAGEIVILGDGVNTAVTIQSDSTGNAELVVPNDSIGDAEIDFGTGAGQVGYADVGAQAADADLDTLAAPTAWRMFYSNGSSVQTELALGAANTLLMSNGAAAAPTFESSINVTLSGLTASTILTADGSGNLVSNTALGDLTAGGLVNDFTDSMFWDAGGITADGTQCADAAKTTINSGPVTYTIICTDNDASSMYGHTVMPDGWDAGTVTFELEYVQTAADTAVLNADVAAMCRGATETINSTWGTEVAIDDAAVTGSNAVDHTTSAAVTANGTCVAGDTLFWRIQLDATGTTTAVATLHFLGVKMEWTNKHGD